MGLRNYADIGAPVVQFVNGDTVKSDTADLSTFAKGFHVNTAGTVKINDHEGNTKTLKVNAGSYYPYAVRRMWSTGHTTLSAADIELAY